MARQLGIGSVEAGIVAVGVGDGGLEIVADHECRRAAEEGEKVDVSPDPVGEPLAWAGLGYSWTRPSLRRTASSTALPHLRGGDVDSIAGEIHENLLAAQMGLPHRRPGSPLPGLVGRAEPRIAESIGMAGAILVPQQPAVTLRRRSSLSTVGSRPLGTLRRRLRRSEKQQLQVLVGHSDLVLILLKLVLARRSRLLRLYLPR